MKRCESCVIGWLAVLLLAGVSVYGQASRSSVPASEVNGTFRYEFTGKYAGNSNEIRIWALGKGRLKIGMDLTYPYKVNGEWSANTGELDGEAMIEGDTAIYDSDEYGPCKITIKFLRPGTIRVDQQGSDADCGFGHNVMASGTYKKVSGAKPKFDRE